jgi:o-succinylbenzoate---CoA ligase
MNSALFYLEKRANERWIIGEDSHSFNEYTQQALAEIDSFLETDKLPKILIAEANPIKFLAKTLAAIATGCPVFLGSDRWGKNEWQQVLHLVQPTLCWGFNYQNELPSHTSEVWRNCIMIPTGGSSGNIRFAIHNWQTLTASVSGFCQYFATDVVNCFCILPLHHVSGLMQFIRCLVTGGRLVICSFKNIEYKKFSNLDLEDFWLSLVPTQLEKLLSTNSLDLARFKTVFLGGAPAWQELLEKARNAGIKLAPTYGMTETASQIATLLPEDFKQGNSSSGKVLPHAQVFIEDRTIKIKSKSLYLGYYPNLLTNKEQILHTDDLGYIDNDNYLYILGRNSHKIITGGENVFPAEVEAVIRHTNLVKDVCVIGLEDNHWGQIVTAIYVPVNKEVKSEAIASLIAPQIAKFKHPKFWISVASIPRNLQGKIDRKELLELVKSHI